MSKLKKVIIYWLQNVRSGVCLFDLQLVIETNAKLMCECWKKFCSKNETTMRYLYLYLNIQDNF